MKKITLKKLVLSASICGFTLPVMGSDFLVDGIDYSIYSAEDKTVYVTWTSTSYSGDIVIPETITVDDETYTVVSVGDFAFIQESNVTSVKLPETLTRLGMGAFSYCTGLRSIDVPSSVRYIGNGVFNGCTNLEEISLPEEVDYLGSAVFGYTNLKTVQVPKGISELPSQLFEQCKKLETVVLPEGITSIGFQAFQNNFALTSINIPSTVETIGNNCFAFCGLESFTIPAALKSYGDNALTNMSSLKAYTVEKGNEYFTTIDGVLYSKDLKVLNSFPLACNITDYQVNESTDSIADYAFYGAKIHNVRLPEGLRAIGKSSFCACANLDVVTVPDNVEKIGPYAFFNCIGMTKLLLGRSLRIVENSAFTYTSALMSVESYNPVPPAGVVFTDETYTSGTLWVPSESIAAYKDAEGWSAFKDITSFGGSGIDVHGGSDFQINVEGTTISIVCEADVPVDIWTVEGKHVFSGRGKTKYEVAGGTAYIVRAGIKSGKIFVK